MGSSQGAGGLGLIQIGKKKEQQQRWGFEVCIRLPQKAGRGAPAQEPLQDTLQRGGPDGTRAVSLLVQDAF